MKQSIIEELTISSDSDKIDISVVLHFLKTESYWAKDRSEETIKEVIKNSLCFSLFYKEEMIGFARVITDKTTFYYLCDVFIIPKYQYKGIGQFFMDYIVNTPELKNCRGILTTQTAHTFYEKFGFTQEHDIISKRMMVKSGK